MNEFRTVLSAVIPVFAIVGSGFALRRLRWLTAEADQSLIRLTVNFLYPCLILDSSLGNAALGQLGNLVFAPLVGFGTILLGFLVARAVQGLAGLPDEASRRTFVLTVGMYNYGFIPIPLAMLLFGQATTGVLFVHNLGVDFAMWTIGVMVVSGMGISQGYRNIINAPLISMMAGLVINATGLHQHFPKEINTTIHLLAQCAIPMSLILAGASIDDHLEEFHASLGLRVIATAAVIRLGLMPICFLALAKALPVSNELKRVIVLQAAMPSAVFPIVMAKIYRGDPPTAVRVVVGTSVVSLLTIPLWIRFGLHWLGLQ